MVANPGKREGWWDTIGQDSGRPGQEPQDTKRPGQESQDAERETRAAILPSPAGMLLTRLSLVRNILIIPGQGKFGK
jgi:hypothetical protein